MTTHGTSHFQNAHHLSIQQLNISTSSGGSRSAIDHLVDNCAFGALYNSRERSDAPKFHPETRVAIQTQILSWITHGDRDREPKRIMWLFGPAGAGKTAIAGSIAKTCSQNGDLAATFFFSSFSESVDRRSKRCVVATLVYQLIQCEGLQSIRDVVLSSIDRDPGIFEKTLEHQFEELILKPFRLLRRNPDSPGLPAVIILDGLDEVEGDRDRPRSVFGRGWRDDKEADQAEILRILLTAIEDSAFPFRIFVSSRPEHAIKGFLDQGTNQTLTLFLDGKFNPDADIELFLRSKFAGLRREFEMSPFWPSEDIIRSLVQKASGQFIFAATVLRYITNGSSPPDILLTHILELSPQAGLTNPLGLLDAVYTHVLMSSSNPRLAVQWILTILNSRLSRLPAFFCKLFLESCEGEGRLLLRNLASLVSIPPVDDRLARLKIYHKSLTDFLGDATRCGPALYVAEGGLCGYRHFYTQRYVAILGNKGPSSTCISVSDRNDFLHRFCCLPPHLFEFGSYPQSINCLRLDEIPRSNLLACDLSWWVHQWLQSRSKDGYCVEAFRIPELCSLLFWSIHKPCPWFRCRLACKLWRHQLITTFKENGWKPPEGIFKRISPTLTGRHDFGGNWFRVSFDEIDITRGQFVPPIGAGSYRSDCVCRQRPPLDLPSSRTSTPLTLRTENTMDLPLHHNPPPSLNWPSVPVEGPSSRRSSIRSRPQQRCRSYSHVDQRRRYSMSRSTGPLIIKPHEGRYQHRPMPPSRRSTRYLSPSWAHDDVVPPQGAYRRGSDRSRRLPRSPTPSPPRRRGRSPVSRMSSGSERCSLPPHLHRSWSSSRKSQRQWDTHPAGEPQALKI